MHAYNVRWNLERDLVDELAVAEVYPAGTVHAMELESMYIRSLAGSFSSRLLELSVIGGTLIQIIPGEARNTASDGGLSIGLQLLQKHAVKLDNDQLIASELRKLQTPHATRTYPRRSFPFSSTRRTTQRITHLGAASRFSEIEDENADQSQMKRLWADKCCFRCGLSGHQWADCKAKCPADPKAFHFANLISTDCPDDDVSIPEDDEVRSYLQAVESGHLN